MKKNYVFVLVFTFCIFSCSGQNQFIKNYSSGGLDLVGQTSDDGYILCGAVGTVNKEIYLIKTDLYGDTLWTKALGDTGLNFPYCIQKTFDDGYIIGGKASGYGGGDEDLYLVKTDMNGDVLWAKIYGGAFDEVAYSIEQTIDSGYIACGALADFGDGIYVIKTDANGDTTWTRRYRYGSGYDEYGVSIKQTHDGGFIILGTLHNLTTGYELYLIKINNSGDLVWSHTYVGLLYYAHSVSQTFDGGYLIGYDFSGPLGNFCMGIMKTDSSGNISWSKAFNHDTSHIAALGLSAIQTNDSCFVIAGQTADSTSFHSLAYLIKTDQNGDTLWTRAVEGSIPFSQWYENSFQQTHDHGFIIAGFTSPGFMLIKVDSLGHSICNEFPLNTFVLNPSLQMGTPSTILTCPSIVITIPTTVSSTYVSNVTTYCSSVYQSEIQNSISEIHLSPNPASNKLTVRNDRSPIKSISIFNLLGEKVLAAYRPSALSPLSSEIDVSSLRPGIYFLQAITDEGIATAKFVKE